LPDGSSKSPDAAYITAEQAAQRTVEDLKHFLRFVPAFVVELRSPSDRLDKSMVKMEQWIENGAQLGWLVDPIEKAVLIYQPGQEVKRALGKTVSGTGPIAGFTLDLDEVWSCYDLD